MPRIRIVGVLAALLFQLPTAEAESCATLEACLARYPVVAKDTAGISKPGTDLAKAVQRYGAQAIPPLLKLLESDKPNERRLAAFTLRDIEGLTAEHLPALMRARRGGDGWIPPAIARIGTPEAVEFLINDLRNEPEMHTQVTYAVRILGSKAVPLLADFFHCTAGCDDKVLDVAAQVLGEMQENAVGAVPRLLQIAGDDKVELTGRRYAVVAIGAIGESARPFVPQLLALKKGHPMVADAVDASFVGIGSSEAVPVLLRYLPIDPDTALDRIGGLGTEGYSAGPAVVRYLEDRRWDVRVAAADTLGNIAYGPAETALAKALSEEDDWKLVYAAVRALAELKAQGSLGLLKSVHDSHWYPPVRAIAGAAMGHIETGSELPELNWWPNGAVEGSPRSCRDVKEKTVAEPKSQKLYVKQHKRAMKRLTYGASVRSYGPPEDAQPDKHGFIEVNQDNMVEHVAEIKQVPDVALKVADGWLVGSDRGEWGGELIHIPERGAGNVLYEENIEDIYLLGSQLVATSGMAHVMINDGFLLRIDKNDTGRYMATPWKRLPASPATSWLIEGGKLLVNTFDGGSVIIDAHGKFRMAECVSAVAD